MTEKSKIFETNYNEYLAQISKTDFNSIKDNLGTKVNDGRMHIPFFNRNYTISKNGIMNDSGNMEKIYFFVVYGCAWLL